MALRDRLRRLQREMRGDADWLDLEGGERFYFKPMDAQVALFLERMAAMRSLAGPDLSEGADLQEDQDLEPEPETPLSPIRLALARATSKSLERFEATYGSVEPEAAVVHVNGDVNIAHVNMDGSRTFVSLTGEEAAEYLVRTKH